MKYVPLQKNRTGEKKTKMQ